MPVRALVTVHALDLTVDAPRPRVAKPRFRAAAARCRLCAGAGKPAFTGRLLGKYDVSYFQCSECSSLQTEPPYWLAESYTGADGSVANSRAATDVGAAQRSLANAAVVKLTAWAFGLKNIVDVGGGDGLLCRLLRDHGLNAFVSDSYAVATYGKAFTTPDFAVPDLVTAFEVVEHFDKPHAQLALLFAASPPVVLISTAVYGGETGDWWYLSPETGQHVFFYSEPALALIAERFGYRLFRSSAYTYFIKPERMTGRARLLPLLLRGRVLPFVRAGLAFLPARGVQRDVDLLKAENEPSLAKEVN